jgi:hypothetical protein
MHETPILVDVGDVTFPEYIRSLSKSAKKNYAYTVKNNAELSFSRVEYRRELVGTFMDLWESQEVAGRCIKWGISKDFVEFLNTRGHLICYAAKCQTSGEVLALQFVEKHDDYVECYPPMFDKALYNQRYLAKYMWFGLIEDAIGDPDIGWLDLGGGYRGTWRNVLTHREFWSKSYKWMYVPKRVKNNPQDEQALVVKTSPFTYSKRLVEQSRPSHKLLKNITTKFVVWVWLNKGRRLRKLAEKFGLIGNEVVPS